MTVEYKAKCPICPFEIVDDRQGVIISMMVKHCKNVHYFNVEVDKINPYTLVK